MISMRSHQQEMLDTARALLEQADQLTTGDYQGSEYQNQYNGLLHQALCSLCDCVEDISNQTQQTSAWRRTAYVLGACMVNFIADELDEVVLDNNNQPALLEQFRRALESFIKDTMTYELSKFNQRDPL